MADSKETGESACPTNKAAGENAYSTKTKKTRQSNGQAAVFSSMAGFLEAIGAGWRGFLAAI